MDEHVGYLSDQLELENVIKEEPCEYTEEVEQSNITDVINQNDPILPYSELIAPAAECNSLSGSVDPSGSIECGNVTDPSENVKVIEIKSEIDDEDNYVSSSFQSVNDSKETLSASNPGNSDLIVARNNRNDSANCKSNGVAIIKSGQDLLVLRKGVHQRFISSKLRSKSISTRSPKYPLLKIANKNQVITPKYVKVQRYTEENTVQNVESSVQKSGISSAMKNQNINSLPGESETSTSLENMEDDPEDNSNQKMEALKENILKSLRVLGEGSLLEICCQIVQSYASSNGQETFNRLLSDVKSVLEKHPNLFSCTIDEWGSMKQISRYSIDRLKNTSDSLDVLLREHNYCLPDTAAECTGSFEEFVPYECKNCSYTTFYRSLLIRHSKLCESIDQDSRINSSKSDVCRPGRRDDSIDNKTIPERGYRQIKVYCCMECEYEDYDKESLKNHVLSSHRTGKPMQKRIINHQKHYNFIKRFGKRRRCQISNYKNRRQPSSSSNVLKTSNSICIPEHEIDSNAGSKSSENQVVKENPEEKSNGNPFETLPRNEGIEKNKQFSCPKCFGTFYPYDVLLQHLESGLCHNIPMSDETIQNKIKKMNRLSKCPHCQKYLPDCNLEKHLKACSKTCSDCGVTFSFEYHLHRHKNSKVCQKNVQKQESIKTKENDVLKCPDCKEIFIRHFNFERHKNSKICKYNVLRNTGNEKKTFKWEDCPKIIHQEFNISRNRTSSKCNNETTKDLTGSNENGTDTESSIENSQDLNSEEKRRHSITSQHSTDKEIKSNECLDCGYRALTSSELYLHTKEVHIDCKYKLLFCCSSCGFLIKTNAKYQGKYRCSDCEFVASNRAQLNIHTKNYHTKDGFKCIRCGFSKSSSVQIDKRLKINKQIDGSIHDESDKEARIDPTDKIQTVSNDNPQITLNTEQNRPDGDDNNAFKETLQLDNENICTNHSNDNTKNSTDLETSILTSNDEVNDEIPSKKDENNKISNESPTTEKKALKSKKKKNFSISDPTNSTTLRRSDRLTNQAKHISQSNKNLKLKESENPNSSSEISLTLSPVACDNADVSSNSENIFNEKDFDEDNPDVNNRENIFDNNTTIETTPDNKTTIETTLDNETIPINKTTIETIPDVKATIDETTLDNETTTDTTPINETTIETTPDNKTTIETTNVLSTVDNNFTIETTPDNIAKETELDSNIEIETTPGLSTQADLKIEANPDNNTVNTFPDVKATTDTNSDFSYKSLEDQLKLHDLPFKPKDVLTEFDERESEIAPEESHGNLEQSISSKFTALRKSRLKRKNRLFNMKRRRINRSRKDDNSKNIKDNKESRRGNLQFEITKKSREIILIKRKSNRIRLNKKSTEEDSKGNNDSNSEELESVKEENKNSDSTKELIFNSKADSNELIGSVVKNGISENMSDVSKNLNNSCEMSSKSDLDIGKMSSSCSNLTTDDIELHHSNDDKRANQTLSNNVNPVEYHELKREEIDLKIKSKERIVDDTNSADLCQPNGTNDKDIRKSKRIQSKNKNSENNTKVNVEVNECKNLKNKDSNSCDTDETFKKSDSILFSDQSKVVKVESDVPENQNDLLKISESNLNNSSSVRKTKADSSSPSKNLRAKRSKIIDQDSDNNEFRTKETTLDDFGINNGINKCKKDQKLNLKEGSTNKKNNSSLLSSKINLNKRKIKNIFRQNKIIRKYYTKSNGSELNSKWSITESDRYRNQTIKSVSNRTIQKLSSTRNSRSNKLRLDTDNIRKREKNIRKMVSSLRAKSKRLEKKLKTDRHLDSEKSADFLCLQCDLQFSSNDDLTEHLKCHKNLIEYDGSAADTSRMETDEVPATYNIDKALIDEFQLCIDSFNELNYTDNDKVAQISECKIDKSIDNRSENLKGIDNPCSTGKYEFNRNISKNSPLGNFKFIRSCEKPQSAIKNHLNSIRIGQVSKNKREDKIAIDRKQMSNSIANSKIVSNEKDIQNKFENEYNISNKNRKDVINLDNTLSHKDIIKYDSEITDSATLNGTISVEKDHLNVTNNQNSNGKFASEQSSDNRCKISENNIKNSEYGLNCARCSEKFHRTPDLIRHIRTVHISSSPQKT